MPIVASASTGTWRVAAYTDPKRPPVGETTFMVEDYVPDRIEFELASAGQGNFTHCAGRSLRVDGHFLYGAPASSSSCRARSSIAAAKERAGLSRLRLRSVRRRRHGDPPGARRPAEHGRRRQSDISRQARQGCRRARRPLEAQITVRMAESGGRAVERKLTLPVTPDAPMIGVQACCSPAARSPTGECRLSTSSWSAPDGKTLVEARGCATTCSRSRPAINGIAQNGQWEYEPVKRTERVANGTVDVAADRPARLSVPVKWGRYRLEVSTGEPNGPVTSVGFDAGFYADASGGHARTCLKVALDKPDYKPGETDERRGDRADRRPTDGQRLHRPACRQPVAGRASRCRARQP